MNWIKKNYQGLIVGVVLGFIICTANSARAEVTSWSVGATTGTNRISDFSKDEVLNSAIDASIEYGMGSNDFFVLTNDTVVRFSATEKTDGFDTVMGAWVQPVNTSDFSARCGILQGASLDDGELGFEDGNSFRCEVGKLY